MTNENETTNTTLLHYQEAAKLLKISDRTIYRMIDEKTLHPVCGRIDLEEINKLLNGYKREDLLTTDEISDLLKVSTPTVKHILTQVENVYVAKRVLVPKTSLLAYVNNFKSKNAPNLKELPEMVLTPIYGSEENEQKLVSPFLSTVESADYLGIYIKTMYNWINAGHAHYYKFGKVLRFYIPDLDNLKKRVA